MLVCVLECPRCRVRDEVPLWEVQVEVCAVTFPCDGCRDHVTVRVGFRSWQVLLEHDRPGGTMISQRELDTFARKSRQFERELSAHGLLV